MIQTATPKFLVLTQYVPLITAVDSVQDKVAEVEIPQEHIEALERINAITIMDRLTYNVHKQSRNAEEVCGICLYVRFVCQQSFTSGIIVLFKGVRVLVYVRVC